MDDDDGVDDVDDDDDDDDDVVVDDNSCNDDDDRDDKDALTGQHRSLPSWDQCSRLGCACWDSYRTSSL